jgi:hypothetical protein
MSADEAKIVKLKEDQRKCKIQDNMVTSIIGVPRKHQKGGQDNHYTIIQPNSYSKLGRGKKRCIREIVGPILNAINRIQQIILCSQSKAGKTQIKFPKPK